MKGKTSIWLIALIILGLVIRLLLLTTQELPETDGIYYMTLGENLITEGKYIDIEGNLNTNLTPGYPLIIGIFSTIFQLELSARLISLISGLLLIIVMYFLGKKAYSQAVGYVAAGITAVYPALTYVSSLTYNDSLFLLILTSTIWLTLHAISKLKEHGMPYNIILYFLSVGLLTGFAYLIRPEGALYTIIFIIATIIYAKQKDINWKKTLTFSLAILIGFILIALPYLLFVHENTGEWTLSTKARFTYLQREYQVFTEEYEQNMFSLTENNSRIKLNPYNQTFAKTGIADIIIANPTKFIKRYTKNIIKEINYVLPTLIPIPLLLLMLYGFFSKRWTKKRVHKEIFFILLILYPLLLSPVFWVEERYLLPIIPICILWLSLGIIVLEKTLNYKLDYKKITIILVILLTIANIFIPTLLNMTFEKSDPSLEQKEAGLWIKENSNKELPNIMSRKPWASFYAEGRYTYLPYGEYKDIMDYSCQNQVNYMIIGERYVEELRPQLAFLLNTEDVPKELELVYTNENHKNEVKVFKLRGC